MSIRTERGGFLFLYRKSTGRKDKKRKMRLPFLILFPCTFCRASSDTDRCPVNKIR
ncbi:Uncharacterized protein dnm_025550 [Desulfonema magnum]|uniref:Uncharacterized protein n=1 Tax=Desulfonema magnum TaxID=45655 RepID=A0A975GM47_9BACT|nr:Uncharacterized protein dnm_025550 [Desulfonema magnum]